MNNADLKHIIDARLQLEAIGKRWPSSDRDTEWEPCNVWAVAQQHQLRNDELLDPLWAWIDSFDDDITRGHALGWLAAEIDGPVRQELRRRRSMIVRDLRAAGWSWGDISGEFGISRPRAQQLTET